MKNEFESMTNEQFSDYVSDGGWMVRSDPVHIYIKKELLRRLGSGGPPQPRCWGCGSSNEFRSRILDAELLRIQCLKCKAIFDCQIHNFPAELAQFFGPSAPSGSAGQEPTKFEDTRLCTICGKTFSDGDHNYHGGSNEGDHDFSPEGRAESAAEYICNICHEVGCTTTDHKAAQVFPESIRRIISKCEQCYNLNGLGDAEMHAILEFINREAYNAGRLEPVVSASPAPWLGYFCSTHGATKEMCECAMTKLAESLAEEIDPAAQPIAANPPVNNGQFCEHGVCCESCRQSLMVSSQSGKGGSGKESDCPTSPIVGVGSSPTSPTNSAANPPKCDWPFKADCPQQELCMKAHRCLRNLPDPPKVEELLHREFETLADSWRKRGTITLAEAEFALRELARDLGPFFTQVSQPPTEPCLKDLERRPRMGSAVIIRDESGRVLVGQRCKDPFRGYWVIPGGGIWPNETINAAAIREIKEETRLDIEITGRLGVFEDINETFHIILVMSFGRVIGGEMKSGDDCGELRWIGPEEFAEMQTTPINKQVFRQLFAAPVTPVSGNGPEPRPDIVEVPRATYGNLLAIWQTALMLFGGLPDELPDIEKMRRRMHEAGAASHNGQGPLINNALTLAKKCLWKITLHSPGYDWNGDPLSLTLDIGKASQMIDEALAATAPNLGTLAAPPSEANGPQEPSK